MMTKQKRKPKTAEQRAKEYARQKVWYEERKQRCIEEYGGECWCCGEDEPKFLTFDHVNNDGAEQRKTLKTLMALVGWMIANNFPSSIQLLCYNCNMGRARNGGVCPHLLTGDIR